MHGQNHIKFIYYYAEIYAWTTLWSAFRYSDCKRKTGELLDSEYNVHFKSFPYWGNAETECQNDMANMCKCRERLMQLPRYYFLSDTSVQVKLYILYTSAHTQDRCRRHVSHTFSNATQENDKRCRYIKLDAIPKTESRQSWVRRRSPDHQTMILSVWSSLYR